MSSSSQKTGRNDPSMGRSAQKSKLGRDGSASAGARWQSWGAWGGTEASQLMRGARCEVGRKRRTSGRAGAGRGWNAGWHVQRGARDGRGAWRGTKARKRKRGTGGRTGTAPRPAPADSSRAWPRGTAPRRPAPRVHPPTPRAQRGSRAARPRARARRDRSP